MNITERKNLRYAGASEYTGLSQSMLKYYVMQNKIPYSKVGKAVVFNNIDLDRWLDSQKRGAIN
jgi:excisionase family DNA binding protein